MTLSKIGKHARWEKLEERFGQTWDGHDHTRPELDQSIHEEKAPPSAEIEQSELTGPDRRHQNLFAVYSAHGEYLKFRNSEAEAAASGRRLANTRRKKNRAVWLKKKTEANLSKAEKRLKATFAKIYRDPAKARKRFHEAIFGGQSVEEIDLSKLGRLRGYRYRRFFSTKARRIAEKSTRQIFRGYGQVFRHRSSLEALPYEIASLTAKAADEQRHYRNERKIVGNHQQRSKRRYELWQARTKLLAHVNETDIWQSNLPEDMKHELAELWVQEFGRQREHERKPKVPTYFISEEKQKALDKEARQERMREKLRQQHEDRDRDRPDRSR